MPAYMVFHDATLRAIAYGPRQRRWPGCRRSAASAKPKLAKYGESILDLLAEVREA